MTKRQLLRVYADRFDALKALIESLERSGASQARIELEKRDLEEAKVDLEIARFEARWSPVPETEDA